VSSPATSTTTCQARDEDVEECDDGVDDTGENRSDTVNDGHESSTDGAEHACDTRNNSSHFDDDIALCDLDDWW